MWSSRGEIRRRLAWRSRLALRRLTSSGINASPAFAFLHALTWTPSPWSDFALNVHPSPGQVSMIDTRWEEGKYFSISYYAGRHDPAFLRFCPITFFLSYHHVRRPPSLSPLLQTTSPEFFVSLTPSCLFTSDLPINYIHDGATAGV